MEYTIGEYAGYGREELLDLYRQVGWTAYTDRPDTLERAWRNSLLTLGAYAGDKLVGAVRAVGDGESVVFVQDLLVHPAYQRRGIGGALLRAVEARYPRVRQLELLTDDTPDTVAFYRALGFLSAEEWGCRAFLKLRQL